MAKRAQVLPAQSYCGMWMTSTTGLAILLLQPLPQSTMRWRRFTRRHDLEFGLPKPAGQPAGFSLRLGLQSFIQRLVSVSHLGQRWTASYRFSASDGCNEMRGITTWQFGHVTRPIGRRFEPSRSLWGWTSTASGMASSRSPMTRQEQPNCSPRRV